MRNISVNDAMFKIIFTDDEMIHGDVKLQFSSLRQATGLKQHNQQHARQGPQKGQRQASGGDL